MRLVIDLQSAQGANRLEVIGQNAMAFAQALARHAEANEVWIVLNDAFCEAVESIRMALAESVPNDRVRVFPFPRESDAQHSNNEWKLHAAEKIREAFIADLRPDVVLVLNIFEGLVDQAVVSIGSFERSAPTVVFLHDLLPLESDGYGLADEQFRNWYYRQLMFLRTADCILTASPSLRSEALERLQLEPAKIVDLLPSHIPYRLHHGDNAETDELRARCRLPSRFILVDASNADAGTLDEIKQKFVDLPAALSDGVALAVLGDDREGLQKGGPETVVYLPALSDIERRTLHELAVTCVFVHDVAARQNASLVDAFRTGAPVLLISLKLEATHDPLANATLQTDMASFEHALESLLNSAEERNRLSLLGLRYAQSLLWEDAAQRAWTTLEELHVQSVGLRAKTLGAPVSRPRMAYFSPLPPAQTGIADYSAVLLPELAFYYDIDVIVDQKECSADDVSACFAMRDFNWFEAHASEYDRVIYHLGNSPFHHYMLAAFDRYPGTVVLHDFYLGHLRMYPDGATVAYLTALYESHGYGAASNELLHANSLWQYPINLQLLSRAHGVIVHSYHAVEQARRWYGEGICRNIRRARFLRAAVTRDRQRARSRLGIADADFVVCSFGQLGQTKLNDRLLAAWAASRLTRQQHCKLVFVGGSTGPYHDLMMRDIEACSKAFDVSITGFASADQYRDYLDAADVAVQLRTDSRGETSAAVFDCLAHEAPLIVNAHGSMSELPSETVLRIADQFATTELVDALERLWTDSALRTQQTDAGTAYVSRHHAPHAAAADFVSAIEFFSRESVSARRTRLIESIRLIRADGPRDESETLAVARALDEALPDVIVQTLYVDVSAVARIDLKTGIQRVTRALVLELLRNPPPGWRVEPVFLSEGPAKQFHYARTYTQQLLGLEALALEDEPVRPRSGDVLLGLDLYWLVVDVEAAYQRWRALGVSIQFVVYDILPILQPENFPDGLSEGFHNWLSVVSRVSDGLLCISKAVAGDVAQWVSEHPSSRITPLKIEAFPLGADIQTTAPSMGMPDNAKEILEMIGARPSVLMVGTVEPRKRHIQALDALERLWSSDIDVNFVVVGKQGWLSAEDATRLKNHKESGRRFFWLSGVSDEFLDAIYRASTVLLAASSGEGFGLPIIEAAVHGVPIIARDLPVFREVAGDSAVYFSGDDKDLAEAISKWLIETDDGKLARSTSAIKPITWEQSARALQKLVLDVRAKANWAVD
jgi:glycosyltransferase involved in cell wall biosynthesis